MGNITTSGKKVLINSVIYSLSGILLKCFNFFLLPLYTVYLTTDEYGINSLAVSFVTTMSYIVAFSLFAAVMRFYVELKNDPQKLKRFYGTITTFVFISSCFFSIIIFFFRTLISKYLFSGVDFYPIIFVSLMMLTFYCQYAIFDNILRSQQRALESSIYSTIFFVCSIALNIFFVVFKKWGALGTISATTICYFLYALYFVIKMSREKTIEFCIDVDLLKEALKYSIPIIPHNLSTQIAVFVSKIFIGGTTSVGNLGIYAVATQFGSIADTLQCYVDNAYGPWLYEKIYAQEDNYKKNIREIVRLLISILGMFFVGISLFAQDYIILFLDNSYMGAWKYIPLIVSVYSIKTIYYFYVEILFYYKDASNKLFWATMSSSLLNIIFSYFLIPILSVYGSILADAIAMIVRVVIVVVISKKYEDIGLKIHDFILNFVLNMSFIFIGLYLSYTRYTSVFSIINFAYKIVVVIIYIAIICIVNVNQLKLVISFVKRKVKNKGER